MGSLELNMEISPETLNFSSKLNLPISMKKHLVACLVFLAISSASYSQIGFGVKAGSNFANVKTDSASFKNRRGVGGLNLGFFFTFPIQDKISIQADVAFSGGGTYTTQGLDSATTNETHLKRYVLNYISIPIMARYAFGSFNVQAGPQIGLLGRALVDDTYVIYATSGVMAGTKKKDIQDFYKKVDFGVAGGVGGEWGRFQVTMRYYVGLLNIANYGSPMKNSQAQLAVGFRVSNDY
jgi:hypothetical protein